MAKHTCVKPCILFVDDELSIRLTLPRILASFGFEVTVVGTVEEAVTAIRRREFDILISDLNLPQPNAGFAVIETMRKAQPRCVNFILTGYPADESLQRASDQKIAHYFIKPVEIKEMIKTIEQKLRRR